MTSWLRPRTGVFPGVTTDPVEVLDVIVQDVIVGSFYHLDTNRWEFLGPWDDRHRMRTDSEEDFTTRDPRTFWLYTDGGFRRDPVRAAIGAVLYDPRGRVVDTLSRTSRAPSNNTAEYRALIEGLKWPCFIMPTLWWFGLTASLWCANCGEPTESESHG